MKLQKETNDLKGECWEAGKFCVMSINLQQQDH